MTQLALFAYDYVVSDEVAKKSGGITVSTRTAAWWRACRAFDALSPLEKRRATVVELYGSVEAWEQAAQAWLAAHGEDATALIAGVDERLQQAYADHAGCEARMFEARAKAESDHVT